MDSDSFVDVVTVADDDDTKNACMTLGTIDDDSDKFSFLSGNFSCKMPHDVLHMCLSGQVDRYNEECQGNDDRAHGEDGSSEAVLDTCSPGSSGQSLPALSMDLHGSRPSRQVLRELSFNEARLHTRTGRGHVLSTGIMSAAPVTSSAGQGPSDIARFVAHLEGHIR